MGEINLLRSLNPHMSHTFHPVNCTLRRVTALWWHWGQTLTLFQYFLWSLVSVSAACSKQR